MPRGIYPRTDEHKKNIALAGMGRASPRRGTGCYGELISQVKAMMASSDIPLTMTQIFNQLTSLSNTGNGYSYRYVLGTLVKARRRGDIDGSHIVRGKGGHTKFDIGDKVRLNPNSKDVPRYIRQGLRLDTPRTVVAIFSKKRALYYLGHNKIGEAAFFLIGAHSILVICYPG